MNLDNKDSPWRSFVWAALTMLVMVACILGISRVRLHEEALDADARFLKSVFEKNLEDTYLQNLESEILSQTTGTSFNGMGELITLLNQSSIACLNLPLIQGVEAYNQVHEPFNLSTSITDSSPEEQDFSNAIQKNWSYRTLSSATSALLVPLSFDGEQLFVEFSLLRLPLENSFDEIDSTLLAQGFILAPAMLVILWAIFRVMIRKISAKEKLLIERTQVLQKTNQELSRAYKTTSLGAMTGHLMHGLRGQLTTLSSLASDNKGLQQQINKIQDLVQQSLGSIKEAEEDVTAYTLTIEELCEIARKKFNQQSPETIIKIDSSNWLTQSINNLHANLTLAILANLFQNSADAKPEVIISLSCQKSGNFLDLEISDNGGGMPTEIMRRLFQPVVSTKKRGSGIGLALSSQLAESMGGSLKMIYSNSSGTSFRLSIPSIN